MLFGFYITVYIPILQPGSIILIIPTMHGVTVFIIKNYSVWFYSFWNRGCSNRITIVHNYTFISEWFRQTKVSICIIIKSIAISKVVQRNQSTPFLFEFCCFEIFAYWYGFSFFININKI